MRDIDVVTASEKTGEKEYVDIMHFTQVRHYLKDTIDHKMGDAVVIKSFAKPKNDDKPKRELPKKILAVHEGSLEL